MIELFSFKLTPDSNPITNNFVQKDVVRIFPKNAKTLESFIFSMLGITNGYEGLIKFNGKEVIKNSNEIRANIQVVSQECSLLENIPIFKQIRAISKHWAGVDVTPAGTKVLKLFEYVQKKPKHLPSNIRRLTELSRLVYCPAKIWIIKDAELMLDKNGQDLLGNLIASRVAQEGVVFFTSSEDFLNNLITKKIYLD